MKALSLAVAAATMLVTSIVSAQTPQTNPASPASQAPASQAPASQAPAPQAPQAPQAGAGASEPLPPLPQVSPSAAVAPPSATAPASTIAEADRGGRGESCRARSDCKSGLACFENVCSLPSDRKTCASDSECGDLACLKGLCSAHPRDAESTTTTPKTTLDLDETFASRSIVTFAPVYSGITGYTNYPGGGRGSETTASSILGFRHRTGSLELEAAIPFALQGRTNDTLSATFGNLTVGAYFARETENVRFRVGGGVALPTAGTSSSSRHAEQSAAYSRGLDRVWLWSPSSLALTPSVLIGSRWESVFQHATEVVLAPLFPTGSSNGSATVVVQISEDLGAHAGLFRGGARAEVVTTTASGSSAQISVLPYVGLDGPGGFADIGLLINLNEPAGFSFDETKYWGLRLRGGLRF